MFTLEPSIGAELSTALRKIQVPGLHPLKLKKTHLLTLLVNRLGKKSDILCRFLQDS